MRTNQPKSHRAKEAKILDRKWSGTHYNDSFTRVSKNKGQKQRVISCSTLKVK